MKILQVNRSEIKQQIRSSLDDMEAIIASPRPDRQFSEALLDKIIIHSDRPVEFVLKIDLSVNASFVCNNTVLLYD